MQANQAIVKLIFIFVVMNESDADLLSFTLPNCSRLIDTSEVVSLFAFQVELPNEPFLFHKLMIKITSLDLLHNAIKLLRL